MDGWVDGWMVTVFTFHGGQLYRKRNQGSKNGETLGEIQAGMIMICRLGTSTCFQKTKPFDPKMWCQQLRVPIKKKLDFLDYGPNETSCRAMDWV